MTSVLKTKRSSPQLFFGIGIVGSITGTVLACKATLRLPEVLEDFEEEITELKEQGDRRVESFDDPYTESDLKKDIMYVYGKNTIEVAKLYAPAAAVGTVAIASLTGSHVAMRRRNASLTAAFAGVTAAYDEYRKRVSTELGKERELDIYHAADNRIIHTPDGTTEVIKVVDPNRWSPYARVFDESCSAWEKGVGVNRIYVQAAQNYFNSRLQVRGHVWLNEVYDHFGFEHTREGAIVGWLIGSDGDNYIDFGMFDAYNADFVNGNERSIILDFNVDGVIFDKLGR
jgi:hypothetical protein